ncbi:MAG TPA: discoidin domain-containing protein [Pseudonocardiaceae bacterium]|nr:discoidin domain-containing protein [Pseudonocardiaceae bacterium]
MSDESPGLSRRGFITTGATLLAGFGLSTMLPATAAQAQGLSPADPSHRTPTSSDLAVGRPVIASSTDYAPTPPEFAVDGLNSIGVAGSGWRAAQGDPQWIMVDLQASCQVTSVVLSFEAKPGDPAFDPTQSRSNTTGAEIQSSYAVAFSLDVSGDGKDWTTIYQTSSGTGAVTTIPLTSPVTARWVRLSASSRSTTNPLGLNGLQVFGTATANRPPARAWTSWPVNNTNPPPLSVAADGTVPVESGWVLILDDWTNGASGATLSGPSVDTSTWLPATVPGTVLGSLVEQGQLPDPVYGMNNLHIPEALSRHAWWYRRAFGVPRGLDTGAGQHVWLEFDGVNNEADVYLNGTSIGTLAHPFGRAAFDVTSALHPSGEQALAVKVAPIPYPGSPGDKGPAGDSFVDAGNEMFQNSPTYVSISGWDWMPAVRDRGTGIWNHVRLRSTGHIVLGDVRIDTVLPNLPDTSVAEVTITVPVRNAGTAAQQTTVSAAFGSVHVSSTVTVPTGQQTDVVFDAIELTDPNLWWPNGYGDPYLYDLALTATIGGATSDTRTVRFGIRKIDYQYHLPIVINNDRAPQTVTFPAQQARYVRLQGGTRATGWGISLWTLSVVDSTNPNTDLALNKTATASSVDNSSDEPANALDGNDNTRWSSDYTDNQWIQVDLGSAVAFDEVQLLWEQAYAQTFGIQVSNDGNTWSTVASVDNTPDPLTILVNGVKVFCRGGSWGFDELLRRMLPNRTDSVVAMHRDMNFTMIRNWIGSSYREELFAAADQYGILVWNEFWDGFGADPANHDSYLAQAQDTVLRYRHHPCLVIWFGCNEGSPPDAINTALNQIVTGNTDLLYQPDSNAGVITGDGPYYWVDPTQYFTGQATGGSIGFHSEIGIPTVSVVESMRNLVGPNDPGWPIDAPWFMHDWSAHGNQAPQTYLAAIDARLGASSSLDEFCRKAQFVNYESMRAIFEAWNAKLWHNASGVLLWMSHPAWHSTVWQTYDYDLDVNGSYYGSRKGCEAHHVQADLSNWQVSAINHTPIALTGLTVSAQLYDLSGTTLGAAQTATVNIAASNTAQAFTVPFDASLPALHLLRLTMTDGTGTVLSENTYWRYRTDTDMQALNQVPATQLSTSLAQHGNTYTATLRNTGTSVAAMIRLSLRTGNTRVLPTLYSDNYFWLLPGESRQITVSPRTTVHNAALLVQGYNVPARTVR